MMFRDTGPKAGVFMLLLSILLTVLPLAAYGEGGDGTGNSQGVFKPLGLVSATLEDGTGIMDAENVPLQPKITMHFDKNVVYLIYWERNKRCFHLYDENGQDLALNLSKIDDTVDFSKRQYIWVEPAEPLAPGTSYQLYVAPDLLAKNGGSTLSMTTNNQGVTINFRTAGEKTVQIDSSALSEGNTPAVAVTGSESTAPDADPVTENVSLSDNTLATSKPDAGTILNQNEKVPTVLAAPGEADEAKFAALQRGRMMQKYVAATAVILLVGWVAVEVTRRKRQIARGAKDD